MKEVIMVKNVFNSKEEYQDMIKAWKESVKENKGASTFDLALYAQLRGRDWRKGLAPGTDLELVSRVSHMLTQRDVKYINLLPFKGTVDENTIFEMRSKGIETDWDSSCQ